MSKISDGIQNSDKQAALIPFITAGFPFHDSTVAMLTALADAGADVIELGVAFSDPMADGSAIQRANEVALANQVSLPTTLAQIREFRQSNTHTPLVLMGYANSFINYHGDFAADAHTAGVNGVIIVDLADRDRVQWRQQLSAVDIDLISLIAPTTAPERMKTIATTAQGFLYFISLRGVTGAAHLQTNDIRTQVQNIQCLTSVPVAVGFGIRTAEQAQEVAGIADAVVIGSRLIEIAEANPADAPAAVAEFMSTVTQALR
ncbi:MAG: tryptophan synthase subunit alpha [Proteobacteria bacterium]|nr:tryptophan synthase subunit alpha [Pseudomonadota bacterium]